MCKNCATCKHDRLRSPICDECYNTSDAPTKWEAAEYYEPGTNAERIRAMSDEELAEFICGIFDDDEYFGKFINGRIIPCYDQHKIAEWLKQPSE